MRLPRRPWHFASCAGLLLLVAPLCMGCGPKCSDGKEASDGHCCWPAQTWSREREACRGSPRCPKGTEMRAGVCASPAPGCPEGMIGIGATTFYVGSDKPDSNKADLPLREVKQPGFCIDRTEVTVAEYKRCVDAGACAAPGPRRKEDEWLEEFCHKLEDTQMTYPVNCVTWGDAQRFCEWAGKRLATAAEWQLAAGRADGRLFPWGDAPGGPKRANWQGGDLKGSRALYRESDGFVDAAPVHRFPGDASPWGVLGMGGNLSEWTSKTTSGWPRIMGGSYNYEDVRLNQIHQVSVMGAGEVAPAVGFRCTR